MIRYNLQCDNSHSFEAWFRNGKAYDAQAKRGLVECPACGSTEVEKAIMAPNVGVKGNRKRDMAPLRAANPTAAEQTPSHSELLGLMRRMRAEIEAKAEYVGPKFAEEARKIHYDEAEQRGIYGEATADDAAALKDEGIDFLALPTLPEEQN
jgi:hypothetical protein